MQGLSIFVHYQDPFLKYLTINFQSFDKFQDWDNFDCNCFKMFITLTIRYHY